MMNQKREASFFLRRTLRGGEGGRLITAREASEKRQKTEIIFLRWHEMFDQNDGESRRLRNQTHFVIFSLAFLLLLLLFSLIKQQKVMLQSRK